MKKFVRFADCLVLFSAIIGCCIRLVLRNVALDFKGLFDAGHPLWTILCILSAVTVILLWLISRHAGNNPQYAANFPKSVVGAVAYLLLAIVMAYTGIIDLLEAEDFLLQLTAFFCMFSAVMLAVAGIERFSGHRPVFFVHLIPCLYFTLRIFVLGREFGSEPQLCTFLFTFLAALAMIPAFYWLCTFDVGMGSRRRCIFWSLTAAFLCMLSTFDSSAGWLMPLLYAACLVTNVCTLQYLPKKSEAASEAVQQKSCALEEMPTVEEKPFFEEDAAEEAEPIAEEMPALENEPMVEEKSDAKEEPSMDATIIEEAPMIEEEPVAETTIVAEEESAATEIPLPSENPSPRGDIDPEKDLDAFLADIKLFLDSESL